MKFSRRLFKQLRRAHAIRCEKKYRKGDRAIAQMLSCRSLFASVTRNFFDHSYIDIDLESVVRGRGRVSNARKLNEFWQEEILARRSLLWIDVEKTASRA